MKWAVADVTVTKLVEFEDDAGSRFLLPQATRQEILLFPPTILPASCPGICRPS